MAVAVVAECRGKVEEKQNSKRSYGVFVAMTAVMHMLISETGRRTTYHLDVAKRILYHQQAR